MPFMLLGSDAGILPVAFETSDLVKVFGGLLLAIGLYLLRLLKRANKRLDGSDEESPLAKVVAKQDEDSAKFTTFQTEVMARLTKQDEAISVVSKEVTVNGGGSLKDAMLAVKGRMEELDARFRLMVSDMQAMIWVSDPKGLCTWVSPAITHLLQRDLTDIAGDNWRSIIYEGDRKRTIHEWDNAVRQGRTFRLEYRLVCGNGRVVKIKMDAVCMKTDRNTVMGWWGAIKVLPDDHPILPTLTDDLDEEKDGD